MLPLLYQSTALSPGPTTMKYLGRLAKCEKCVVSEQINVEYGVTATIAPTDELIGAIQNQLFLAAKPNPFDPPQYFEIYDMNLDGAGRVVLSGRHVKHCCYNNIVLSDYAQAQGSGTPAQHWAEISEQLYFTNYFTFSSGITDTANMAIGYTKADSLGKFLEELAAAFGAEYHYNNFEIELMASRGSKKNYVLRWNKNIGSPSLDLTTASIYSHVAAYGDFTADYTETGGGVHLNYPMRIVSPTPASLSGTDSKLFRVYMYDATQHFQNTTINPQTQLVDIKSSLNSWASYYRSHGAKTDLQIVEDVNLRVDYRPALDEMSAVGLGDTVDVMLKGGRTVEAKITKTEFDSLSERWTAIELGKERVKLSKYIAKTR